MFPTLRSRLTYANVAVPSRFRARLSTSHYRLVLVTGAVLGSLLAAAPAQAAPTCFGQEATIIGTNGPDNLPGTSGADVIVAKAGGDEATGLGRDDRVCMGAGSDRFGNVFGSPEDTGDDRIDLGGGDDAANAGPGGDLVLGGDGNDGMGGAGGRDRLFTGPGTDCRGLRSRTVDAGAGNDLVNSGPGNDCNIDGGDGDDELYGGGGDDTGIKDHSGADQLFGGDGDDSLDAQDEAGDDTLRGGPLTDTCAYDIILGGGEDDVASCELEEIR
jgi:Ca2+-binding RTX toxin-like protein